MSQCGSDDPCSDLNLTSSFIPIFGNTLDIDQDGCHFMGDPKNGWIDAVLRVRTKDALTVFQFREDGSLRGFLTQPYVL